MREHPQSMGRAPMRYDAQQVRRFSDFYREIMGAPDHLVITQTDSMIVITAQDGQTTRLSPAVTSARSQDASPLGIVDVAKSERAASFTESGPRSSSVSTRRSRESRASCIH